MRQHARKIQLTLAIYEYTRVSEICTLILSGNRTR
jgi:hypothetical protein